MMLLNDPEPLISLAVLLPYYQLPVIVIILGNVKHPITAEP